MDDTGNTENLSYIDDAVNKLRDAMYGRLKREPAKTASVKAEGDQKTKRRFKVFDGGIRATADPAYAEPDTAPMHDSDEARRFFEIQCAAARHAFCDAISNDVDPGVMQLSRLNPLDERDDRKAQMLYASYEIDDVNRLTLDAVSYAVSGCNVYFEGRTVRRDKQRGRGGVSDTVAVWELVIDSDSDKGKTYSGDVEASLIVQTSEGNHHHHFHLDKAIGAKEAQELGKVIKESSQTDHDTGVITQPYRVGGTLNYPTRAKRERGRDKIEAVSIVGGNGKRWTPDELRAAFPAPEKRGPGRPKKEGREEREHGGNEASLSAKLRELIVNYVPSAGDDQSRVFFGAVCSIKRLRWSLERAQELFEKYPNGVASKYATPTNRIAAEVARIWNKTEEADDRAYIVIAVNNEVEVIEQTEAALIAYGKQANRPILDRSKALVVPIESEQKTSDDWRTGKERTTKTWAFSIRDTEGVRIEMIHAAHFAKVVKRGEEFVEESIPAPSSVARAIMSNDVRRQFPAVVGISATPLIFPNGDIISTTGYNEKSGLFVAPNVTLHPIPDRPTKDQCIEALEKLEALIGGFPFEGESGPGNVNKSVALSAILTASIRAVLAFAPLFFYRAPRMGTGKSHLVETTALIGTGRSPPVLSIGDNEEEAQKVLSVPVMESWPFISIDNLTSDLCGRFVSQMLTQEMVAPRILGFSKVTPCYCRITVTANGNNVSVAQDLSRRTMLCNLNANMEQPETRSFDFDPVVVARQRRAELLTAAFTIIRGFLRNAPDVTLPSFGGYEQWSHMVRGPLVWLDRVDPFKSVKDVRQLDPSLQLLGSFLSEVAMIMGVNREFKTGELIRAADNNLDLRDTLAAISRNGGALDAIKIGKWLKAHSRNMLDGYVLKSESKGYGAKYWIESERA